MVGPAAPAPALSDDGRTTQANMRVIPNASALFSKPDGQEP